MVKVRLDNIRLLYCPDLCVAIIQQTLHKNEVFHKGCQSNLYVMLEQSLIFKKILRFLFVGGIL